MTDKGKDSGSAPASQKLEKETSLGSTDEESGASSASDSGSREFPVVAIGASAGGLEALKALFGSMPVDTGLAFVVVTHQHPGHKSLLPGLLGNTTEMPVVEAVEGMKLLPDRVHVAPPGVPIVLSSKTIREKPDAGTKRKTLPIDLFFHSLAEDCGRLAICVVLSGTGADGTLGLRAVKGGGGMAMVQELESARFAGMPSSAIATSQADYVLAVEDMAEKLVKYADSLKVPKATEPLEERDSVKGASRGETLQDVFRLLRSRTGHDFSEYKLSTLRRRIERRMNVHHVKQLADYVRLLRENPHEIDILFKEFLIGVTCFFRDPESFASLADNGLVGLLKARDEGTLVRAWVVGCGSGEEAYTVAILLHEAAEKLDKHFDFQVFSTDLDSDSIECARAGRYPAGIANDIDPARLETYFEKEETSYRVRKDIRDMVVFAPQNVISDPPFTRLDLICCRNVLIYMNGDLQKRVLPMFHYALRRGGLMMLGPSETIGEFTDLFEPVDKKNRIYRKTETDSPVLPELSGPHGAAQWRGRTARHTPDRQQTQSRMGDAARQLLLSRFAPTCVLVNQKGDVVYIHGRTGRYLEPSHGEPPGNIFTMAREGLRERLGPALRQAAAKPGTIVRRGVRVKTNGDWTNLDLGVTRIVDPESLSGLLLITFEPSRKASAAEAPAEDHGDDDTHGRVADLQHELQFTKESLQTTVEELETSNEELKSTNEELQSTNEELTTVNNELQAKVDELADANNDMQNLLNSTDIATVFIDDQLCIKRYTKQAKNVINLIDSDIGRPIGDLAVRIEQADLEEQAEHVLETLRQTEAEVRTTDGSWYLMRMSPYRTVQNVIDGVVITFVEIGRLKENVAEGRSGWELYESIFDTLREPVVVLDEDFTIVTCNDVFYRLFRLGPKHTEGKKIFDIDRARWDIPELRTLLQRILPENEVVQDCEVTASTGRAGTRKLLINARRLQRSAGMPAMILLVMEDVTDER
jgi:two-component system CheB/CheR fusion protein